LKTLEESKNEEPSEKPKERGLRKLKAPPTSNLHRLRNLRQKLDNANQGELKQQPQETEENKDQVKPAASMDSLISLDIKV